MRLRLDKYLANSRVGSRSEVKEFIKKGRVTVNQITCKDSSRPIDDSDEVCLNGQKVKYREHVYYMLNKPAGVVSATEDASEKTVIDLFLPQLRKGLFPVGRLDKDSVGLLLITDDGDFSHRLMTPSGHVDKCYLIKTDEPMCEEDVTAFRSGIVLADGTKLQGADLDISKEDKREAKVTIHEGKYHQVKRMIASRNNKVTYLKRLSIGDIVLDPNLEEGSYRELTEKEISKYIHLN